jgi:hypothetical protein
LIGRLKPTLMQRARPMVAPVVLLGWVVAFAVVLPFWQVSQQHAVQKALRDQFGASIGAAAPRGISVKFSVSVLQTWLMQHGFWSNWMN